MLRDSESDPNKNLTLIIETAMAGGSLALFDGERLIETWQGSEEVSKSEDILEQVDKLLRKNNVEKTQLDLIKVAKEQGSAVGLKIGLAIAKGLADALQIRLIEVSTAESLLVEADFQKNKILVVLPTGKNLFLSLFYERRGIKSFELVRENVKAENLEGFQKLSESADYEQAVFHQKAFQLWKEQATTKQFEELNKKISTMSENLATLIGKTIASDNDTK